MSAAFPIQLILPMVFCSKVLSGWMVVITFWTRSPAPAWLEFCLWPSAEHFSSEAAAASLKWFDYTKSSIKFPDFRPPCSTPNGLINKKNSKLLWMKNKWKIPLANSLLSGGMHRHEATHAVDPVHVGWHMCGKCGFLVGVTVRN